MPDSPPLNVVIAGAGRAGLEAMFRLHRLADPRAQVTVIAPDEVLRRGAPGWPPTKITGRELALHLDAPLTGSDA